MWLLHNQKLIPYICIDSYRIPKTINEYEILMNQKKEYLFSLLADITNFLNLNLLARKPRSFVPFATPPCCSIKEINKLSSLLQFCMRERHEQSLKHFSNNVTLCNEMIDFLGNTSVIPDGVKFTFLMSSFFKDLLSIPFEVQSLSAHIDAVAYRLCILSNKEAQRRNFSKDLAQILKNSRKYYISYLYFADYSPEFDTYCSWLFDSQNPIMDDINTFLQSFFKYPRNQFTDSLLLLYELISKVFPTNDPIDGSIHSVYFLRAMFDEAVTKNYSYFHPNASDPMSNLIQTIKCRDIIPPKGFLPEFDNEEPVYVAFQRDSRFIYAGHYILSTMFLNNPLDMIYSCHLALKQMHLSLIESGKCEPLSVLPFEAIFSLFFGSLIISNHPNLTNMIQFILDFSPSSKLAPEFHYLHVSLEASLAQLQILKTKYQNML